jgi:hypothetical protein
MNETVILSFPKARKDDANIFAEELRKELRRLDPNLTVDKQRDTEAAQDFGATLAVIITSAAATALAKGIANFISKRGTKISIRLGTNQIEATGIESKDLAALMTAINKEQKK